MRANLWFVWLPIVSRLWFQKRNVHLNTALLASQIVVVDCCRNGLNRHWTYTRTKSYCRRRYDTDLVMLLSHQNRLVKRRELSTRSSSSSSTSTWSSSSMLNVSVFASVLSLLSLSNSLFLQVHCCIRCTHKIREFQRWQLLSSWPLCDGFVSQFFLHLIKKKNTILWNCYTQLGEKGLSNLFSSSTNRHRRQRSCTERRKRINVESTFDRSIRVVCYQRSNQSRSMTDCWKTSARHFELFSNTISDHGSQTRTDEDDDDAVVTTGGALLPIALLLVLLLLLLLWMEFVDSDSDVDDDDDHDSDYIVKSTQITGQQEWNTKRFEFKRKTIRIELSDYSDRRRRCDEWRIDKRVGSWRIEQRLRSMISMIDRRYQMLCIVNEKSHSKKSKTLTGIARQW